MSEQTKISTVDLYRIENPNIPSNPNGVTSYPDLVGQWFSPSLDKVLGYLHKSTQTHGREATPVDGARLVVAHVPTDRLESLHVSRHPIPVSQNMETEPEDFLIARDGDIMFDLVPLDDVIPDLRGRLNRPPIKREAKERICAKLSEMAMSNSID